MDENLRRKIFRYCVNKSAKYITSANKGNFNTNIDKAMIWYQRALIIASTEEKSILHAEIEKAKEELYKRYPNLRKDKES